MFWLLESLWIIVWGVLLSLAGVVVMAWYGRRKARTRTRHRIVRQFSGMTILALDTRSYFYGLQRHWDVQWRGHGVLLLTEERLYFRLLQRNLDLSIPTERIREISINPDDAGKLRSREVLQVRYQGADDQLRVATWLVRKPELWLELLEKNCEESSNEGKAQEKHLP